MREFGGGDAPSAAGRRGGRLRRLVLVPGDLGDGESDPRFLSWLDRRVAAPAASSLSGVALPVAQAVASARHDA